MKTDLPDYEETTYGQLRTGDVILPWNVEDVAINGEWTVTLIGPVPLRNQVEYQTNRTTSWTRVESDVRVRIRRRLPAAERNEIVSEPEAKFVPTARHAIPVGMDHPLASA